jgi:hypothetical protein
MFKKGNYKHRFKWLMISLHGALYSFGVCAIKGSSSIQNVYDKLKIKKSRKESLLNFVKETHGENYDPTLDETYLQFKEGKLLDIWTVLERCQMEEFMRKYDISNVLKLNEIQKLAIDKLIFYRNHFAHLKPNAYGFIGNYVEEIVKPVIEVIAFLAIESNNILYCGDKSKERVKRALTMFEVD